MTTGATGQLGLALPVQGELSGTWGDTVNNGITQYTNIAIAGTLTLTGDGAVTLANTTGDATASNITSTLSGAGTVTAQFAIIKVTGTLTTAKIITAPSYSKTYLVVNAATGSTVSFIRSGQTPAVSIAVGESAYVYYNGTDYVKLAGTSAVTSFTAGTTGFTPSTATTGAVTLAGTLAVANGGTGLTAGTSGGIPAYTATGTLTSSALLTQYGVVYGGGAGAVPVATAAGTTGQVLTATTGGAPSWSTPSGGVTTFSAGTTGFTPSTATAGAVTLAGTLNVANGGTGLTTLTAGYIPFGAGTSAFGNSANLFWDSTNGRLGLGTTTPSNRLEVNGSARFYTASNGDVSITHSGLISSITAAGSIGLAFGTNNTEKARLSSAGGFGVGTTADPGAGAIYATGNITAYYSSDIKFKENVRDIPDALATVNAIGGKLFDWTDDYIDSKGGADGYFVQKADFGVVAQDVQKVFPIAVRTREDGSLAVDYEKLGALAFAALVELTKRVEALEAK